MSNYVEQVYQHFNGMWPDGADGVAVQRDDWKGDRDIENYLPVILSPDSDSRWVCSEKDFMCPKVENGYWYTVTREEFEARAAYKLPPVKPYHIPDHNAVAILSEASRCISNRAAERDTESERSMAATVAAFNAMFGTSLTEVQGWQFMELLKMSRSRGGAFRLDDFVDGAAYAALAGEAAAKGVE